MGGMYYYYIKSKYNFDGEEEGMFRISRAPDPTYELRNLGRAC